MRKIVLTAILCAAFAASAYAQQSGPMKQDGRVTLVDRGGKAFSAQWYAGSATYRTTPNTAIMAGSAPTSFAAIRAGARAQIDYHREGTTNVADRINVTYQ